MPQYIIVTKTYRVKLQDPAPGPEEIYDRIQSDVIFPTPFDIEGMEVLDESTDFEYEDSK